MRTRPPPRILLGLLTALALVLTGCGSGGETASEPGPTAAAPATTGAFPVSIAHRFGTTTVPAAPTRVVTIGFNEQDYALAFGVEPVGVRAFLGYDAANRPWAPASVRGRELPTVGSQELDLEAVAALRPDLILGVNSYVDEATYAKLSAIAPTVAESADFAGGGTPWPVQTELTGQALGQPGRARELVEQTRAAFDRAVAAHPGFRGRTAAFGLGLSTSGVLSMGADDYRTGWLTDLGFEVPKSSGEVSLERLGTLDSDVLVTEGVTAEVQQQPTFRRLAAVQEGRFVDLGGFDDDFAGALGFNSPLSLPFVLEVAVPRLAAATDGDPGTRVPAYP